MIDEMMKQDTSDIVTDNVKTLHLENDKGVAIADVNQIKANALKKFETMKKKILKRKYVSYAFHTRFAGELRKIS